MPGPRVRGPYAKTAQRRNEIVDAATTVFATSGYNGGSLRDIARQLDLSLTSVVHHFGSKYALLEAVLDHANEIGGASVWTDCAEKGVIYAILRLVRSNLDHSELLRLLAVLSAESSSPGHPAHAWFVDRYDRILTTFAEAIRVDQSLGRINKDRDAATLARVIVGAWDGIQLQWLIDPTFDMEEPMRQFFAGMIPEAGLPSRADAQESANELDRVVDATAHVDGRVTDRLQL